MLFIKQLLGKLIVTDAALHAYFMERWPRSLRILDRILEAVFSFVSHGAFSLIVGLLLTVLAATQRIGIIVALCLGVSLLVAFIWISRATLVRKLSVLGRLIVVFACGVLLTGVALLVDRWSLANQQLASEKLHPHEVQVPIRRGSPVAPTALTVGVGHDFPDYRPLSASNALNACAPTGGGVP